MDDDRPPSTGLLRPVYPPKGSETLAMTEVVLLLLVVVLLFVNGFFVAAEFAIVKSRRWRMEQAQAEAASGLTVALEQLDRVDEYFATCSLASLLPRSASAFSASRRSPI